jgi:type I restriction enzyme R subunit
MAEVIAKLNEVFGEDTTVDDQLVYVNHVLMGKLMESETLRQQAANNSREQFGTSPDLRSQIVNAAMDAQDAHMTMSNKLLNSPDVLNGVLDILLNHSRLWEALRGPSKAPNDP